MSRITKSAGIVTAKSITTTTPKKSLESKQPTKKPLAKKAPPKQEKAPEPVVEPAKTQSTGIIPDKPTAKTQSTGTKKTRKPRTKKNATTKAPPFKPTVMFVFTGLNGMNIAQGYLRGAGMTFKSGKMDDGRPAIQVAGRGTVNKDMLKMFRQHLKNHRIQYEEEKV